MPTDSNQTKKFLSPAKLAAMFDMSISGVYLMVAKRQIPFHKMNRKVRFDEKDIASYVQQTRIESVGSQYYDSKKI